MRASRSLELRHLDAASRAPAPVAAPSLALARALPWARSIGREIHGQNTETIYVIEGSGEGFINDDTFAMAKGDIMHVEKNQWHGLRNTGSEQMKIIVVGSPDY